MKHSELLRWIVITTLAIIILLGFAYSIQKPQSLQTVGLFTPSATPTPLSSENITLYQPRIGEHVPQRLVIQGKARVFENVVSTRLKNKLTGEIYGQTHIMTNAKDAGQFGNFGAVILLDNETLKPGIEMVLEVYQESPKDSSEVDKISVPLTFSPTAD